MARATAIWHISARICRRQGRNGFASGRKRVRQINAFVADLWNDPANSGTVRVNGTDLKSLSGSARDKFRAEQIGVIFQQFNLLPFGSVLDNILLPLRFAPQRRKRCENPKVDAAALCRALGLPDKVTEAKAATLSVGQQQRVAVTRALIGQPPILIADEPTSSLDETAQANFLDLMFDQVRSQNSTLLMVSHNPRLADRFDRVVQMSEILQVESRAA